jgi:hypothetical protein
MVRALAKPALGLIKYSRRALNQLSKRLDSTRIAPGSGMENFALQGRAAATKDLGSTQSLNRLMNTVSDDLSGHNTEFLKNLYEMITEVSIRNAALGRIPLRSVVKDYAKHPVQSLLGKVVRGSANPHTGKVSLRAGLSPNRLASTSAHEFTHIGQLTSISRPPFDRSREFKFLADKVFGGNQVNVRYPSMRPMKKWEGDYLEKIKPHFTGGYRDFLEKILSKTKGYGKLSPDDKHFEYFIRPRELSARAAQIRWEMLKQGLTKVPDVKEAKGLLKELLKVESEILTKEGIKKTVGELWGAAPIAGLLKYGDE